MLVIGGWWLVVADYPLLSLNCWRVDDDLSWLSHVDTKIGRD